MQEITPEKLFEFYRQCLQEHPPIASVDIIRDSQTTRVIEEIFKVSDCPNILDYGCGDLRLLNALLTNNADRDWSYEGVDIQDPRTSKPELYAALSARASRNRWCTSAIAQMRTSGKKFDVAILMNVLHELSVQDIASSFEDLRRLLKADGALLLVDTVFLADGEPKFVPVYPREISFKFRGAQDLSYVSRSGIPILFFRILQSTIPSFYMHSRTAAVLTAAKRDVWAKMVGELTRDDHLDNRRSLGLGSSQEFDLAYLSVACSFANYRCLEYESLPKPAADLIDRCAYDVIALIDEYYSKNGGLPTVLEIFDAIGLTTDYEVIEHALIKMQGLRDVGGLIQIIEPERPIMVMEAMDMFQDFVGAETILSEGIEEAVRQSVALVVGARQY